MASGNAAKRTKLDVDDPTVAAFIDRVNTEYETVHLAFEEQFWGTKMALQGDAPDAFSTQKLSETKAAMEVFLGQPELMKECQGFLDANSGSDLQRTVLTVFKRTFSCYQMADQEALALRKHTTEVEDELNSRRNLMRLGYTDPTSGEFVEKSSVGLRTLMRTAEDEAVRKAAWEGLRSIGQFILDNKFLDVVKGRNQVAKKLGYKDFFDYKVTQAEGFSKDALFDILDTLRKGTDGLVDKARARLADEKGASALEPWNTSFMMAGSIEKELDPYGHGLARSQARRLNMLTHRAGTFPLRNPSSRGVGASRSLALDTKEQP
eukprot:m.85739 g.85739  ORF g.85739 m.85739 type:complete len:321 (+) comp11413_c0_seq2:76-1038(+)